MSQGPHEEPVSTEKPVTDAQIRDETRANPAMLDQLMVAIHSTDHELRSLARAEFADAISARAKGGR